MTKHEGVLEEVLQTINRERIALNPDVCARNIRILNEVLYTLIQEMKQGNPLFKRLMKGKYYGGSYFDRLRVGEPNEFDIDFLLCIPQKHIDSLCTTHMPGFVKLKCHHYVKELCNFKGELVASKVYSWFRSVLTVAMNECFEVTSHGQYIMRFNRHEFRATLHFDTGPAATLKLYGKDVDMDIDLVPCFQLSAEYWPGCGFRVNPFPKATKSFLVVPKSPTQRKRLLRGKEDEPMAFNTYWRLSFQKQESRILKSRGRLKSTLKLLKRLRDVQEHTVISSYYIKNILLSKCTTYRYKWNGSLAQTFLDMFKEYLLQIEQDIPYFWHSSHRLLEIKPATKENIMNRLRKIYMDIERDPYKVYKYLEL